MPVEATVKLEPAQPCMVWNGVETCGKPATVGTIAYYSRRADIFIICRDCAAATAKLYGVDIAESDGTISDK